MLGNHSELIFMPADQLLFVLLSCAGFMLAVAWFAYQRSKETTGNADGYFLAGRGLSVPFIAGSLLLTNLSAEQLIGLNGSAYGFNMSAMGWEVTAAVATIAMAFFFLPRYLRGAFTTLPQFLADRFDDDVRRISVILFLLGYGLVTIPSVLYSGSVAVLKIFDVPALTGWGYVGSLWFTVSVITIVGSLYAVLGGLKAVAVSDTLNGIGLLIIGITVPVLGLQLLGSGNFAEGLSTLTHSHQEKLNAIGAANDPTPFGTLFTGMVFANLFYWCSNQYVIQRTLAAKTLAAGQQGVLLSGFFKVLVPFFMMIPGVIAYHLYGPNLASIDLAYPQLARDTLPLWAMGFFLAVLLGAVFSSFNSLINSAATMFTLDVIQPMRRTKLSELQLVRTARWVSIGVAAMSLGIAPLLQFAPEGLWQIIRIFTGFYNIPIIAVVLIGMLTSWVPARAVKLAIGFHIVAYGLMQFVFQSLIDIHFLHLYAILFVIEITLMLTIGWLYPGQARTASPDKVEIDMTPWPHAIACSTTLFSCVIALYALFSPIGLAGSSGSSISWLMIGLIAVNLGTWFYSKKQSSMAPFRARAGQ